MSQQSPEKNVNHQPYDDKIEELNKQDVNSDTAVHPVSPPKLVPNDYLVLSIVVLVVCTIISASSLLCSIPAVVCSIVAMIKRKRGLYATSEKFALSALILNCLCVAWMVAMGVLVIGMLVGCFSEAGTLCRFRLRLPT